MKRIPNLPRSRLNEDYRVLLSSINKRGIPKPHDWLIKIINDIFLSYVRSHVMLPDPSMVNHIQLADIDVPKPEDFVHHIYIEACRRFWMNPALFSDKWDRMTQQQNLMTAKTWINESIYQSIRDYIPLEQLEERVLNEQRNIKQAPVIKHERRKHFRMQSDYPQNSFIN